MGRLAREALRMLAISYVLSLVYLVLYCAVIMGQSAMRPFRYMGF